MFALGTPWWEIVVRSLAVYLVVYFGLRVTGKRELGQMTAPDLVVILLIANAVQNAMVGPDASLVGGLLSAAVLLAATRTLGVLRVRSGRLGALIGGTPTVLIERGRYLADNLRREGLDQADLEMAMREHGVAELSAVQLAYLETDGTISIVPVESRVLRSRRHVRQMRH